MARELGVLEAARVGLLDGLDGARHEALQLLDERRRRVAAAGPDQHREIRPLRRRRRRVAAPVLVDGHPQAREVLDVARVVQVVRRHYISGIRRDAPQIRAPRLPPLRVVAADLVARRRDDDQRPVEGHEDLAEARGVLADERVDGRHLGIVLVRVVELAAEPVRALAQVDAVLLRDDLQALGAGLRQVAVAAQTFVDDVLAEAAEDRLEVVDGADVEVAAPECVARPLLRDDRRGGAPEEAPHHSCELPIRCPNVI